MRLLEGFTVVWEEVETGSRKQNSRFEFKLDNL